MFDPAHLLICPIDGATLTQQDKVWHCQNNHQFDMAKQGYLNLLPVQHKRSKSPGDTKEMVQARRNFLETQTYAGISKKLNQLVIDAIQTTSVNILDAGCGEGYYLSQLKNELLNQQLEANLYGLDIAKFAIQAAAKTDKLNSYLVASNRSIPVADHSLDFIICAFGFPVFEEFAKKLKPDGKVILVESGESHLLEIRQIIYPSIKPYMANPYPQAELAGFKWQNHTSITYQSNIDKSALADLLLMTPHIHKASNENKAHLNQLDNLTITIDVNFRVLTLAVENVG